MESVIINSTVEGNQNQNLIKKDGDGLFEILYRNKGTVQLFSITWSVLLLIFVSVYFTAPELSSKAPSYQVWCTGICNKDFANAKTAPGTVLMGGGDDVDEAFQWQIKNAGGYVEA